MERGPLPLTAAPADVPAPAVLVPLLKLAVQLAGCEAGWLVRVDGGVLTRVAAVGLDGLQDPWGELAPAAPGRGLVDLIGAHALLANLGLLVHDLTQDPRFAAHAAALNGQRLRWGAGLPLRGPDGLAFGALCLAHPASLTVELWHQDRVRQVVAALEALHAQCRQDALAARAFEQRLQASEAAHAAAARTAQGALHAAQARLQLLSESSPVGVFHTDAGGRITFTNARWQAMFALTPVQALGVRWLSTVHPEDVTDVRSAWQRHVEAAGDFRRDFRVVHPDGTQRVLSASSRAVNDAHGRATGFVGNVMDITEHLQTIERLRASESFLDRTGRIANVGGWEYDLQTGRLLWSAQTARMHARLAGEAASPLEALRAYPPDVRALVEAAVRDTALTGQPFDLELPVEGEGDRVQWVRVVGEAERENDRIVRVVGAFQDITDRRLRQAELEREQDQRLRVQAHARELDRLLDERSRMLDVLAHEVRQPLNNASAALQSAEAVLRGQDGPEASSRLVRAQRVVGQVMARIDNTLAAAELVAGGRPIVRQDTDIDTLIALAVADMPASDRGRVRVERATHTRTASMDLNLMRLALRNVLSNALDHTPAGRMVAVRVSDSDDPLALLIDVIDQGPGVGADVLPHLFQRGARGSSVPGRPSLGLGLYIVRRVMELHGGQVELAANSPQGATLRLWLTQMEGV